MRIFVTGSSGFIGSAVMKAGAKRGHAMTGFDLNGASDASAVAGNIDDVKKLLEASRGCDAMVHAAALHAGSVGKEPDHAYYRSNILGSANMFQAALENGISRFVLCSTLEILCGADWRASGIVKYTPETPAMLSTVYGTCKHMTEQIGHYHHNANGLQFCALRYTNVAWTCKRPEKMDPPLRLLGRDITVEDAAEATLLACEADEIRNDVLLVGQDTPLTSADLVRAQDDAEGVLEEYWPGCLQLLSDAGFSTQCPIWPLTDMTATRQILRWKPQHDFSWFLDQVRSGLKAEGT